MKIFYEGNIIVQKLEDDTFNIKYKKNLINVESTSKPLFEVHYLESFMKTIDYRQSHPPRREVTLYTDNNLLLKTIGKRRLSKVIFFEKDSILFNIIECDSQLYNTYLE